VILTGQKLEEFGRKLWGDVWISVLSKKLNRNKKFIMRLRDRKTGLSLEFQRQLLDLGLEQLRAVGEVTNELAGTFDDQ
jgi:hypothetical protein